MGLIDPFITEGIGDIRIDKAYKQLLEDCIGHLHMQEQDLERVDLAFRIACEAHKDMKRRSGEPYILHPIAVARIVANEIGMDATSVICALMHDVVEDTEITLEDVERDFDKTIAMIIDGLTKISKSFSGKESSWMHKQAESVKKILLTMGDDIRVIMIKLADRLHNMRTMDAMPTHKQLQISSETMFIYAPIAHRLGLYRIKSELEDLCMKYTQRKMYKEIAHKLTATKGKREKYIQEFIDPIKKRLEEHGLKCRVFGRSKHIYSIWNKVKNKGVPFEEIYDLFAIRIVIDVPEHMERSKCWEAYSVVTHLYKPNVDRLRDWVSHPKMNGYESLHTTVMGPEGKWVEVQIRSKRMDEIAEKGVAAHWKYKEKGGQVDGKFDNWLSTIRDFLKDKQENALDFVNEFRHNLYENEIYVFTPKGEVRTYPVGATVLDFAFDIHTDIGCQCIGAKIDGKLQPISYELKRGDQIEILTSKKQKPNEDWLNHAHTSRSRTKIKSELKNEKRRVAGNGKEMLDRKLRAFKINGSRSLVEELARYFKFSDTLDFLYNVAIKKFDLNELKSLSFSGDKILMPKEQKKPERIEEQEVGTNMDDNLELSIFEGFADKVDYSISQCCNPVAGDDVFGFISIGRGIRIHRRDCPNAHEMMSRYPYRAVNVKWAKHSKEMLFLARLIINGIDDVGLVNRLTNIISADLKLNMRSISLDAKDGIFKGDIRIYVKDVKHLNLAIKKIKQMDGVFSVERVGS